MSFVWELALPPTEKIVLLALADQASDEGRQCWPSVARIARRCGLAHRTIRDALGRLEAKGHLTRDHRDGATTDYRIHPDMSAPRAMDAAGRPTADAPGATLASLPPSRGASRVPADFTPVATGKTGAAAARWLPGRLAAELEQFTDYHRARGTLSFDWQASWRSWVRKTQRWEPANGVQRQTRAARVAEPDPILAALRRAVAEERAERGEADHPRTRPALSSGCG